MGSPEFYATATPRGRVHTIRRVDFYTLTPEWYRPYGPALCGFKPKHGWLNDQKTPHENLSPCRRCFERATSYGHT